MSVIVIHTHVHLTVVCIGLHKNEHKYIDVQHSYGKTNKYMPMRCISSHYMVYHKIKAKKKIKHLCKNHCSDI